jgi:N6-adenosine-specific RNA methylase IME4
MTSGYDVLVIDPPWPMVKIERKVRPNQTGFDYPTMSIAEITETGARAVASLADDAHVFLWATNKYFSTSIKIVQSWGLTFKGSLVWHKPGGFQPWNMPQLNAEFVTYAQKGSPSPLRGEMDSNGYLAYCFDATRGKHSQKPEVIYYVIDYATGHRAEPRLTAYTAADKRRQ